MRNEVDIRMRLASLRDVVTTANEDRQDFIVGQLATLLWLSGIPFHQAHVDAERIWDAGRLQHAQWERQIAA